MALAETPGPQGCSDCVTCGKPVQQIQEETVTDYLDKTVVVGETLAETEARRRAFIDGMTAGTFLLMHGECRGLPPAMATGTQLGTTTALFLVRSQSTKRRTKSPDVTKCLNPKPAIMLCFTTIYIMFHLGKVDPNS